MKTKVCAATLSFFFMWISTHAYGWGRHDLLTRYAIEDVQWLDQFDHIQVTPFKQFVQKVFTKDFTKKDFLAQYQLQPSYTIGFKDPTHEHAKQLKQPGEKTTARSILIAYSHEPDWGMDRDLNISPDQKFMGGTKGPTSQAFRHFYYKKWSLSHPLSTLHFPPRAMGEALKRAQLYYILAEDAFQSGEPYWAFRFLAWSLHYIQDLGQPFHSNQLLTPKFISWNDLFNFKKLNKRTTQIISNYHFVYERYVVYQIQKEIDNRDRKKRFIKALGGTKFVHSSSALLLAKHISDFSNGFSYVTGENCFTFFGKKFLDASVDVPNQPHLKQKMAGFGKSTRLSRKVKNEFLKNTAETLRKTGVYTRSLLELAKEEFLK